MQLGISTLGHLVELGLKNSFKALADLQLESFTECLDFAEEKGINIVELVIEPPELFKNEYQQKFIELLESYSLNYQVHAPFIDVNLCSHNNRISEASIESCIDTIILCHKIGAKILTIHPGLANFMLESIRAFNKEQLKRAIYKLLDFTKKQNLIICLENMPQQAKIMTDNKNIEEVLGFINHKDLFLTYDTSHFYMCEGNVEQLWSKFHSIIKNIHIVDNLSKESDTHPPLGNGKIDFKEIFHIINKFNYEGPLIIELSSAKSLNQSINFISKFL
ncbi:MAG: sugar phosphate isomerase/epimerase family protein [Promethearchaeota archaeon]